MSFQGLQPAYKAPKVTTPDDSSVLTLMYALTVRANDLYTIASALTDEHPEILSQLLLPPKVNRKNIGQTIHMLNYLADVIGGKLTTATSSSSQLTD